MANAKRAKPANVVNAYPSKSPVNRMKNALTHCDVVMGTVCLSAVAMKSAAKMRSAQTESAKPPP